MQTAGATLAILQIIAVIALECILGMENIITRHIFVLYSLIKTMREREGKLRHPPLHVFEVGEAPRIHPIDLFLILLPRKLFIEKVVFLGMEIHAPEALPAPGTIIAEGDIGTVTTVSGKERVVTGNAIDTVRTNLATIQVEIIGAILTVVYERAILTILIGIRREKEVAILIIGCTVRKIGIHNCSLLHARHFRYAIEEFEKLIEERTGEVHISPIVLRIPTVTPPHGIIEDGK
ncbi:MAG: hypothetical protein PHX87_02890 [Candidatus Peribacteraceae bacterium]|nr:hypothetical protein [Candidatus Peribacteraceae bacterium]MDD5742355.1 hypothetical protein [Candidatus Peribacteraceae bacterium]